MKVTICIHTDARLNSVEEIVSLINYALILAEDEGLLTGEKVENEAQFTLEPYVLNHVKYAVEVEK
jgi:hypothetical protein